MGVGRAAKMALGVAGLLAASAGCVEPEEPPLSPEQEIRQATVVLLPPRCAGALVGRGDEVLTAAHCVDGLGEALQVRTSSGTVLDAHVSHFDPEGDLALLQLSRRAREQPLAIAPAPPSAGDPLFFAGRADMDTEFQSVMLRRLGRCPSLPHVASALFTTLRGRPGESGAPVVDEALRVVGLVHGGAACSIATPVAGSRIAALVEPPLAPGRRSARAARQARRAEPMSSRVRAIPPGPVCQ